MFKNSRSAYCSPYRTRHSLSPMLASPSRPRLLPSLSPPRKSLALLTSIQQRSGTVTAETLASAVIRQYILPMLEKNAQHRFKDGAGPVPTLTTQLTAKLMAATQALSQVKSRVHETEQDWQSQCLKLTQLRQQLQSRQQVLAIVQAQAFHGPTARDAKEANETEVQPCAFRSSQTELLAKDLAEERRQASQYSGKASQAVLRGTLLSMQNNIMGAQIKSLVASMTDLAARRTLEDKLALELKQIFQTASESLDRQYGRLEALHLVTSLNFCTLVGNTKKCKERNQLLRSIYQIKHQTADRTRRLQRKLNNTEVELAFKQQLIENLTSKVTELNLLHARDKETLRMYLVRTRRTEDEQVCMVCKKTYWESQNFNWSCSIHLSEWNGSMYWCCGQYSVSHPGCVKTKHINQEEAEALQRIVDGQIACSSCKSPGHLKDTCPLDPNVRGASCEELERVAGLRRGKARRNKRFASNLRFTVTRDDVEDELEEAQKTARLIRSLSPPFGREV